MGQIQYQSLAAKHSESSLLTELYLLGSHSPGILTSLVQCFDSQRAHSHMTAQNNDMHQMKTGSSEYGQEAIWNFHDPISGWITILGHNMSQSMKRSPTHDFSAKLGDQEPRLMVTLTKTSFFFPSCHPGRTACLWRSWGASHSPGERQHPGQGGEVSSASWRDMPLQPQGGFIKSQNSPFPLIRTIRRLWCLRQHYFSGSAH